MSQSRGTYPSGSVVTVFRSRRRAEADDEYADTAARMETLARAMPGFVEFSRYSSDDGEHLSFVVFASREAHEAWRDHPEHRDAQLRGREAFYETFDITVGDLDHHTTFARDATDTR